jgi:Na+-translocating ferredoxin:NAD+ oxidoreductase RnfC subunit
MKREEALKKIFEAGVVGAGGAGFPTHKKLDARVEYILANGAECEPMMFKDREVMLRESASLVNGLELMQAVTGAEKIILGIKDKNSDLREVFKNKDAKGLIDYLIMKNVYPAGDEYVLVYEATGRRIPPGGIPLQVGAVVNNVESIVNIANAVFADKPVTEKYLTITGAVANPVTVKVPIGISFRECLDFAGGAAVDDFAVLTGGVMMGGVEFDLDKPVTKTLGGLIVLPKSHYLVRRKTAPKEAYTALGHSACDQCSMCTELCPRYLLGYPIQPHRVMRSLQLTGEDKDRVSLWAQYCCECNICSLFSCPEGLDPKSICADSKSNLREKDLKWDEEALAEYFLDTHPVRDGRQVPIPQLMLRLGLTEYDRKAPFLEREYIPAKVVLPLRQHIGVPALPVVNVGDKVSKGQAIARPPEGSMGVPVHASIDGRVTDINAEAVTVEN